MKSGVNFAPWCLRPRQRWGLSALLFIFVIFNKVHGELKQRLQWVEPHKPLLAPTAVEAKNVDSLKGLFDVLRTLQNTLPQTISLWSLNLDTQAIHIQGVAEDLDSLQDWIDLKPFHKKIQLETQVKTKSRVFEFKISMART